MDRRGLGSCLCMWVLLAGCATGGGVEFNGEDDSLGSGGSTSSATTGAGGSGGEQGQPCTGDAYCQEFGDTCNRGVCVDGFCSTTPWNDGDPCEDDDMCTTTGTCSGGTCQGGPQIDCTELDDMCGVGVCDSTMGCVKQAANEGGPCDDGVYCTDNDTCDDAGNCVGGAPTVCPDSMQACAEAVCDSGTDACVDQPITMCIDDDDCCPSGCTLANDDDCNCEQNLALSATPSSSGGGTNAYGVAIMNNSVTEPTCEFHWINNGTSPAGAYAEYQWPSAVTIGSFYVAAANATNEPCSTSGRNMFSGTVQYWDGAAWATSTTFTGQTDDVQIDLPSPVTTTRLRIYDITSSPGNGNTMIFEWYVYPGSGCTPM